MKIVIVTSRFPWPIEKGDKLRIYHQLRHLSQHHEILLISIVDKEPSQVALNHLQQYCTSIEYYLLPKNRRIIQAIYAWINGQPAQVGYFYNSKVKKKIYERIIAFQPERIYCQLVRVSEYVKTLPYVKVLDYMDTFSSGMKRQSEIRSFPYNLFYKRESTLIQRYERSVYSFFDETIIISERDKNELPILSKNLVKVVPNGIDTDYFTPDARVPQYDLVFVGNLGYKPNEQAVLTLLEWYQRSDFHDVKVLIAGARPTAKLLAIEEKNWTIAGWMDDIRDAYRDAQIFVAPLTTGSGLQNKILEAMSCGLPCVTTSLVNDSVGAQDNADIVVADSQQQFETSVKNLLADKTHRQLIGKNARNFVLNKYQWSEFNTQLEQIIINAKSKAKI